MMKAKLIALMILATLLLTGCASNPNKPSAEGRPKRIVIFYPTDTGSINAHSKLTEAAVSATDSLSQIAAIEKATQPKAKLKEPVNPDSIRLGTLASVDWTGPIEPLVQKLAGSARYKYRVVGKRPAIPVIVSVYAFNLPIADILRDTNFQGGKRANIVIYPRRNTIELRYDS
jgi:defect-in-organelle-trafficking protein DotD